MHYDYRINEIYMYRGYMAPEYVVRGKLTEKVDVYGFGVLVIEVVCGKRNNSFTQDSFSILQMVPLSHALYSCSGEKCSPSNSKCF